MRLFTTTLTVNNLSGPFTIFYKEGSEYVVTDLASGGKAINITSTQLLSGVDVFIPFTASEIAIQNNKETCGNLSIIIPPSRTFPNIPTIA